MSRLFKHLGRAVLVSLTTALLSSAQAAVLFTIERIDDTHARLVGSGTLGLLAPDANGHVLALAAPFGNDTIDDGSAYVPAGATLNIGTLPVDFAFTASAGADLFGDASAGLYFGNSGFVDFAPGAAVSGHIDLSLSGGATFAAAGTGGKVTWGVVAFANPQDVGEWIMVDAPAAVPEPGSLALGGIALAGLLAARRRRT